MFSTVSGVLAANVAPAGTFTVGYPTGFSRGNFATGLDHKMSLGQADISEPEGMTLSFGASVVTVTNTSTSTWQAGTPFTFQFDRSGTGLSIPVVVGGREVCQPLEVASIDLGSPIAPSANAIALSQSVAIAPALTLINGALGVNGVADLGLTGRAVVAAWTNTAVLTVRGFDMFGRAMTESSGSGTSFAGKKAFKIVTSITFSAAVTGATVGTSDILGLPVRLPSAGNVLRELENGATATAGTIVAAQATSTAPTALTADIRGTYDPSSACDGSRGFMLIVVLGDPRNVGELQFAG